MSTLIWIGLGIVAVCLLGSKGKTSGQKTARKPTRIDHPHYIDLDEYECGVCGCKFRRKTMTCPRCGARFAATREDDSEFVEEMILWDDDD